MKNIICFVAGLTVAILIQFFFNDGKVLSAKEVLIGLTLMWLPILIIEALTNTKL